MIVHKVNLANPNADDETITIPNELIEGIGRSVRFCDCGCVVTKLGNTIVRETFGELAEMVVEEGLD